jgi:Ca2+-binding EF-hand superfamily protein
MKTKVDIFNEYFWQTFDRQIDFKEYLEFYGKKWNKLKRKEKIKRLFK